MATCLAVEDCEKPALRRGWCSMHYERWKTHGDFTTVRKPGNPRSLGDCQVDDGNGPCGVAAIAHDLCAKHYQRWKKFGDPAVTKLDRDLTPEQRFWAKVDKNGPLPEGLPELGPCWVWTAAILDGYAAFTLNHQHVTGHLFGYRLLVGKVPDGLTLDHVCHTVSIDTCPGGKECRHRRCVNPAHLEPVTVLENVMRGLSPHAINAAKTNCGTCGLPYDKANTRMVDGERHCINCARRRSREWYYRQKEARTV
jgi:hypothetical protein